MEKAFTMQIGDVDFYAQQRGDHAEAVFLHGFGDDLSTWDRLWSAWEGELSALRYDLRGFGQSTCKGEEPFSHGEDLLAIMDHCQIDRCDLYGVSMGGSVALNFALDHPERVNRLILISPGIVAWEWSTEWSAMWRPILALAQEGKMDQARQLWWQHPLFATTRESVAAEELHDSIMRYSGKQWIRDNERAALPDVDRLYRLNVPTLLLTGGCDVEEFRTIASLIEAGAPGVTRVDLPGLGHLPHIEDAVLTASCIADFLIKIG